MKIALDPSLFCDVPLRAAGALVADLGYEWIVLSPREDVTPFFPHPCIDKAAVDAFRAALRASGVGDSSTYLRETVRDYLSGWQTKPALV